METTVTPKPVSKILLRLFSFCLLVLLARFAYSITVKGQTCESTDFCFFPRTTISGADAADLRRSYYASVFRNLLAEGFLSTNSNSLSFATHESFEIHDALKKNGVASSSSSSIRDAEGFKQPFKNHTFDFVFSSSASLDRISKQKVRFAFEVSRILKPGGYFVVHLESANHAYGFNSLMQLVGTFTLINSHDVNGVDSSSSWELVFIKKEKGQTSNGMIDQECSVPRHKLELIEKAEPLIKEEPLKPIIEFKRNIKNVKYLSNMVDISFKNRYVYVDVGARSYGSSIGGWFNKQYPKQGKPFEMFVIAADSEEYTSKKGVTLLPYAAWIRNETLFFEISRESRRKSKDQSRGVQPASDFISDSNKIQGLNLATWLTSSVTSRDYVVVKMDVEGSEFHVIPHLIATRAVCLIDEMFLDCHYNNRWHPKYHKTYDQCLELFSSLRRIGLLVHQWWPHGKITTLFSDISTDLGFTSPAMNESLHNPGPEPPYVCHFLNQINARGLLFGQDPLSCSVPALLLQLSLFSVLSRAVHFLLKPLGQPLIVAQILSGAILGPSGFGHNPTFLSEVFPRKSRLVLDTLSIFGFMIFIFLIGVKMDLSMVVRSGKVALAVGILGFFVPFGLAGLVSFVLNKFLLLDHDVYEALPHVVSVLSMTAFPVITCFLDELKILNTEIGRLASSSSVICDICLWSIICIKFAAKLANTSSLTVIIGSFFSAGLFIIFILYIIRPAAWWVVRNTPEPRPVKEIYILLALVILMSSAFVGEVIGIHATTASLVLGLVIPDGPPLGAALVETLDCFISVMLLPLFFTVSGLQMDVFSINFKSVGIIQLVVFVAFVGKILGSMLPLVYFRMPFRDALSLGLIMNTKGIVELAFLSDIKNREILSEEMYTIMIISVVAVTGIISFLVKALYDPSKRFVAYKRRTILHCSGNDELRILACVHSQEHVHSIISLLQLSHPTKESPIELVVLHLVKLSGRASSLLVAQKQHDKPCHNPTQSEHIFNAFRNLEQQNPEFFLLQCYKGISPPKTMYNDVCSLALEKRTILVILPFQNQSISQGTYRHLNKLVLEKAPCSVGILIDHQDIKFQYVNAQQPEYRVTVLFFGGADDREALAYALKMSDNAIIRLTLVRFLASGTTEIVSGTERSKMLDTDILNKFKQRTQQTERIVYKEKMVTSGTGVISVARWMANACNLVLVGRRHGESPIILQLAEWNKHGELGPIGEILAASEFKSDTSVLVVQQQTRLWGLKDPEESTHLRRIKFYRQQMSLRKVTSSTGYVQGPHDSQETLVCQFTHMINAQGRAWLGGDPFAFTLPVLLLQLIFIFSVISVVWFLLEPLKQGLAGVIMGRSFLGRIDFYNEKLFPVGGRLILETIADVGFMFHLFILGVHVDLSLVKQVGRSAVVIGAISFFMPLTIGLTLIFFLNQLMEMEASVKRSLPYVACLNAISSFPVITSLLTDLNILNSELGRVATLACLICEICNYVVTITFGGIMRGLHSVEWDAVSFVFWPVFFLLIIVFGLRTIILLIAKHVPAGQQMTEIHFISIVIIILLCGLGSEISGQPAAIGAFFLGVFTPDRPPLGSSLVNKLDTINTGLLVPAKFVISGLSVDLFSIGGVSGATYGLVIIIAYLSKFASTLIPALFYSIHVRDAVTLALIMCCRGIVEAVIYITLMEDGIINNEAYALLLISMLIVTGIARPLIWHLYDPSASYLGQRKNSILSNTPNDELRMMVCIHNEDNVPTIINLLDASTPLRHRPLAVFVLNLMELKGRGASVLESTTQRSKLTNSRSWSQHVANAINLFAERSQGCFVRHFTSIAPYASMHNDICSLALDQNANIVILPFHKQWTIDGKVGSNFPSIRMVNQNVISKSPCSVGVLIDRGLQATRNQSVAKVRPMLQITIIFLSGPDDCEALAYASRFLENPQINLTFVWIRPWDHKKYGEDTEKSMDTQMVNQFRAKTIGNERVVYREELVKDAIGTTRVIRSIEDGCDLCIVGRYHEADSSLVFGLTEWSECPELGLIGDMLATSDFNFSVLVVQQQPLGAHFVDGYRLQPIACGYSSSSGYDDQYQHHSFQASFEHSKRT
ncbi:cation/H(+) antiporter 15-like [Dorcoceras hygrometricum]|uniref:Cation/H(+) antiporter 15-like n=1 Tax=Dorcoceras hygrometricum TaxID=472368 RepID=A0A2Z7C5S3_9LAMI|nr:cation/H(+) antiporter 15-like [Dorcoceras hygrometricum]